ncbi:MAG: LysR substrate-binding domain-containing protein, partial [Halomonas sp.]
VTYVHGFTGRGQLERDFSAAGVRPDVVLSAADSDVIKTYVRLGFGVGIIAHMAFEPGEDTDLAYVDASHLLSGHTTRLGFHRGTFLRGYMYEFASLIAPHLTMERVDQAAGTADQRMVDELFGGIELPCY